MESKSDKGLAPEGLISKFEVTRLLKQGMCPNKQHQTPQYTPTPLIATSEQRANKVLPQTKMAAELPSSGL